MRNVPRASVTTNGQHMSVSQFERPLADVSGVRFGPEDTLEWSPTKCELFYLHCLTLAPCRRERNAHTTHRGDGLSAVQQIPGRHCQQILR